MFGPARVVAGLHAAYLAATGAWPLVHRRSFERVTGPKAEFWLVRTVGGLALASGISLGYAVLRRERRGEVVLLALAHSLVFGAADVRASQIASRIYLGDALLQMALAPAWLRRWEAS